MVYLNNAAGSRPYTEVIETINDVLKNHWGNASADDSFGHDAKSIIDNVTRQVADDINCNEDEIIWTSGACEANSLAIHGFLESNDGSVLCTTKLEHTSIEMQTYNTPLGVVYELTNNDEGFIDLDNLEKTMEEISLRWKPLVSVCYANSEIGVVQDIKTISEIVHRYDGILHVDATQMYPWHKIDVQDLGIDLMSVSGQKLNCVRGIGFLYVRNGIALKSFVFGNQQKGRRGGSYPTHLIAAFGKALELTRQYKATSSVRNLRNYLMSRLFCTKGVRLNGPLTDDWRLPNNLSLTIDGVKAETLTTMCDLMGVIIGKGSACKSYEPTPSKALLSIGLTPEQALNTIRISLDEFNTLEEINEAADVITQLIERIRANE